MHSSNVKDHWVLRNISFAVHAGEALGIVGQNGAGKSTLLNQIGLLDTPTGGELYLLGEPTSRMDDHARTAARGRHLGFVFQFQHMISAFTALENVMMPMMVSHGRPDRETSDRARSLLADVGLEKFADRRPTELSGGQQQRVAIA
ncbi:ABC transporter ATP-binding protein, partial [Pseudoxanthomonas broegbernensis]